MKHSLRFFPISHGNAFVITDEILQKKPPFATKNSYLLKRLLTVLYLIECRKFILRHQKYHLIKRFIFILGVDANKALEFFNIFKISYF
eukprot:UN02182